MICFVIMIIILDIFWNKGKQDFLKPINLIMFEIMFIVYCY